LLLLLVVTIIYTDYIEILYAVEVYNVEKCCQLRYLQHFEWRAGRKDCDIQAWSKERKLMHSFWFMQSIQF